MPYLPFVVTAGYHIPLWRTRTAKHLTPASCRFILPILFSLVAGTHLFWGIALCRWFSYVFAYYALAHALARLALAPFCAAHRRTHTCRCRLSCDARCLLMCNTDAGVDCVRAIFMTGLHGAIWILQTGCLLRNRRRFVSGRLSLRWHAWRNIITTSTSAAALAARMVPERRRAASLRLGGTWWLSNQAWTDGVFALGSLLCLPTNFQCPGRFASVVTYSCLFFNAVPTCG